MHRWLGLFSLVLVSLQTVPSLAMELDDCKAAWMAFYKGHGKDVADGVRLSKDGWCIIPAANAAVEGFDFDRIEWRAEGLHNYLKNSLPPTALTIRVADADMLQKLGLASDVDAPPMPMQILLALRVHADARLLAVETLQFAGPKDNSITLSGAFHDVDLTSTAKMQLSLGSAKLRDVELLAFGNSKLRPYISPYIGDSFSERSYRKSAMVQKVKDWPDQSFPEETKRAVIQLITALPAPSGVLRAKVDMGAGLSIGAFVQTYVFGRSVKDLGEQLLAGMVFHATWSPAE